MSNEIKNQDEQEIFDEELKIPESLPSKDELRQILTSKTGSPMPSDNSFFGLSEEAYDKAMKLW